MVSETILHARRLDYPAHKLTLIVCDDGGDDSLKEFIEHLNAVPGPRIKYVRRKKFKGKPHHFKAPAGGARTPPPLRQGISNGAGKG